MVPLVIAPAGGKLGTGADAVTVQRTFATARSVEFDAVVLAGVLARSADALGSRDAKAGDTQAAAATDPRLLLLVSEAYRHGKAVGAWNGGEQVLTAAGCPLTAPGVVTGDSGAQVLDEVTELLAAHRVWERFPTTL